MDTSDRLTQLEAELKVLKNEVLSVLLDVKEKMLDRESPFAPVPRAEIPSITITQAPPPQEVCRNSSPRQREENYDRQEIKAEPARASNARRLPERDYDTVPAAPDNYNRNQNRQCPERREQPLLNDFNDTERPFRLFDETSREQQPAFKDSLPLSSLAGLVGWVETTTLNLGSERTQVILDVSEMMGQLPGELKAILEKIVARDPARNPDKVFARDYLSALKELAKLLGSKNTADFVALHIVSHGLNSLARSNQNG